MRRLQNEINKSFGDFWEAGEAKALPDYSKNKCSLMRNPLTDLQETDKEVIAKIEIPGVDKKDIQLNITENRIEVKAEKKHEAKVEKKGFYREERSYSGFYRTIPLPFGVTPEKAKVRYQDGVLKIKIPKTENKNKSKIEIEGFLFFLF